MFIFKSHLISFSYLHFQDHFNIFLLFTISTSILKFFSYLYFRIHFNIVVSYMPMPIVVERLLLLH